MKKEKESFDHKALFDTHKETPDVCVCPGCGYEIPKRKGLPCRNMKCPVCNQALVGK